MRREEAVALRLVLVAIVKPLQERAQRRRLESFHGRTDPAAVAAAWPFLASSDRNLRFAARIALATAASGGTIGTSPTPRTPYGCCGFGTSTRIVSIIGRSDATGMR